MVLAPIARFMRAPSRRLDEASTLITASMLVALFMWAVDVATWASVREPRPFFVSAALSLANGVATGLVLLVAVWLPVRYVARSSTSRRLAVATAVSILLTAPLLHQAAPSVRAHSSGMPILVTAGVMMVAVLALALAAIAKAVGIDERAWPRWLAVVVLGVLAIDVLIFDRTRLSSTMEKPYSFAEGLAHVALTIAYAGILTVLAPATSRRRRVFVVLAATGACWLAVFVASGKLRFAMERSLPLVWEDSVYAARWLRRARDVEAIIVPRSSTQRLSAKYSLPPTPVAADVASVLEPVTTPITIPDGGWNVVVFFVDTLRADVARDAQVMPQTIAWMNESASFTRAYSTASSTVLTLAPMLGCRYDATPNDAPRLLDSARAAGMRTALVIPSTAYHYHRGAFPAFRFEHEEVVRDMDRARVPTAATVVDRSLDWLRKEQPSRFFLWLYQFDVHGWSDLDEQYVEGHVREAELSKAHPVHFRYRAAARGVDQSFARLLRGLDDLGLSQRTIVLFVSDHGEALGHRNFWAHSTYLWESLIRVPLAVRVPGRAATTSESPVSTIDVASTLHPFVGGSANGVGCHGTDLLAQPQRPRSHPILFSAMVDGRLTRVGILGRTDRKVVVDLRDADARLLRLDDGGTAEDDVSAAEPEELSRHLTQLVSSPIYPQREQ